VEPGRSLADAVQTLCVLHDHVRRSCYEAARHADEPATRAEVAETVGISARLAAFHLDKLLDAGLLEADYRRPPGRGRGGGRPAKRYRPSAATIDVALPPRRYDVVAAVLAESAATGAPVTDIARRTGAEIAATRRGSPRRRVNVALSELGFEPATRRGHVIQRNCPFRAAQQVAPVVICEINCSLVEGMLGGAGDDRHGVLAPEDGRCCVVIAPPASGAA
jgi:predicted ArsR family transcriptional regulator